MALQSTPRITVGFMYYNYWMGLVKNVSDKNSQRYLTLAKVTFYLYMIENGMAIGTAFISNTDNYREYRPDHERNAKWLIMLFIIYVFVCYFNAVILLDDQ